MIKFNPEKITLQPETTEKQSFFCDAWPVAKVALESLKLIFKNPYALLVAFGIAIVVAAGDAVHKKICK